MFTPSTLRYHLALGVTHIVNAAAEVDDVALYHALDPAPAEPPPAFAHVPWHDDMLPNPVEDFHAMLAWMTAESARCPQIVCYIHCVSGVNRGPVLATFLIAALSGVSLDAAWKSVRALRPCANGFYIPAYRQSMQAALDAL